MQEVALLDEVLDKAYTDVARMRGERVLEILECEEENRLAQERFNLLEENRKEELESEVHHYNDLKRKHTAEQENRAKKIAWMTEEVAAMEEFLDEELERKNRINRPQPSLLELELQWYRGAAYREMVMQAVAESGYDDDEDSIYVPENIKPIIPREEYHAPWEVYDGMPLDDDDDDDDDDVDDDQAVSQPPQSYRVVAGRCPESIRIDQVRDEVRVIPGHTHQEIDEAFRHR